MQAMKKSISFQDLPRDKQNNNNIFGANSPTTQQDNTNAKKTIPTQNTVQVGNTI